MADISEKDRALPVNETLSDKAAFHDENLHTAAERGNAATDQ